MIDTSTKKQMTVSADGTSGPYIMVPVSQIAAVQKVLDSQKVPYFVDEIAISLDDEPEIAVFNLGRSANACDVQTLLDAGL